MITTIYFIAIVNSSNTTNNCTVGLVDPLLQRLMVDVGQILVFPPMLCWAIFNLVACYVRWSVVKEYEGQTIDRVYAGTLWLGAMVGMSLM